MWAAAAWQRLGRPDAVPPGRAGSGRRDADGRRAARRAGRAGVSSRPPTSAGRDQPRRCARRRRRALARRPAQLGRRASTTLPDERADDAARQRAPRLPARPPVRAHRGRLAPSGGRPGRRRRARRSASRRAGRRPAARRRGGRGLRAVRRRRPPWAPRSAAVRRATAARRCSSTTAATSRASATPCRRCARHAKVDPLANPGEADLTVHADFPAFWPPPGAEGARRPPIHPGRVPAAAGRRGAGRGAGAGRTRTAPR